MFVTYYSSTICKEEKRLTIVEEATQAELDELIKIDTEIFGEKALSPWILRVLLRYGKIYTLKEKNELIGTAYCMREWADEKNVYLMRFLIKEGKQDKEYGNELIGELLKILKQEKFSRIKTKVEPQNLAAIQILCNHYGFNGRTFLLNEEGKGKHRLLLDLDLDRMTFRRGKEKRFYIKSEKKDALSDNRMLANPDAPAEIRRLMDQHYVCKGVIRFKGKDYLYFTKDLTYI